jgi:hypothetical protein
VADPKPRKPPKNVILLYSDHAKSSALDRSITDSEIVRAVYEPTLTKPGTKPGRVEAERGFPGGYIIKAVYDLEPTAEALKRLNPGEAIAAVEAISDTAMVLVTVIKVKRRWRTSSR